MLTFLYQSSLAYIATAMATSGVGHVIAFSDFRALVRAHRIIPPTLSLPLTIALVCFELSTAGAATALLLWEATFQHMPLLAVFVPGATALAGLLFVRYVRGLLRRPVRASSCGCSPVPGPLTALSLVPARALLVAGATALLAHALGGVPSLAAAYGSFGLAALLAVAWGPLLALIVMLIPGSVSQLDARAIL